MDLRNRKIPALNFGRGESMKNMIFAQSRTVEPCTLIDLGIEDDVNLSTSSLTGLSDQSLAYEVRIQNPATLQDAINIVTWHECCRKNVNKNFNVRQVNTNANCIAQEKTEDFEVCRTDNPTQYVTPAEFKMNIDNLKKEFKMDVEDIKQDLNEIKDLFKTEKQERKKFGPLNRVRKKETNLMPTTVTE
ncbi:Hypothetical predicted protein [Mytilus galloprovincialis]|uniref:Uncharacterized protein n=1 Tax=Mytilus galloprovincialis TaxID=29158 RepID=A0A8B6DIQ3_MYTGA|nr:Hypothetical predicted protein [Mytilus galloprovincialis]